MHYTDYCALHTLQYAGNIQSAATKKRSQRKVQFSGNN